MAASSSGSILTEDRISVSAAAADATAYASGHVITAITDALTTRLLQLAGSRGLTDVCLHAQHAAAGFYRRAGFRENGAPFAVAGIAHVKMTRPIDP